MDLITDLPLTTRGHDAIFVVVDRLSKMTHVEAIKKTISAKGLAEVYADRVFRYHGVPASIVSDRDTRFTSLFWKELSKGLVTKLQMSTAYHPRMDKRNESMPYWRIHSAISWVPINKIGMSCWRLSNLHGITAFKRPHLC